VPCYERPDLATDSVQVLAVTKRDTALTSATAQALTLDRALILTDFEHDDDAGHPHRSGHPKIPTGCSTSPSRLFAMKRGVVS
jgi:hypothetical protein